MHFGSLQTILLAALSTRLASASPPSVPASNARSADASTHWDSSWVLAGPAPYAELQNTVAGLKPPSKKRGPLDKRVCEGVYMCDGADFSGSCYYGCYPISTGIYPDPYWASRIVSVGPDEAGWCEFYGGGDCDDTLYEHVIMAYPGGNLPDGIADQMGCFYCNPSG